MKTKIVGWLYIAASAVFFLGFLLLTVMPPLLQGGMVENKASFFSGFISLLFGIVALSLGSAIKKHAKWSWYVSNFIQILSTIGNILSLVVTRNLNAGPTVLALAVNAFCLYALFSEKKLFLK